MIRDGVRRAFQLALRRRDRWQLEVEDEIKLHLTLRAEQLMARGVNANDAYDEAVRKFGPLGESRARLIDAARHRERRMQRTEFAGDFAQDVRFALRTLGRQKIWTAITVITLALGIGATTAVFSVVSTLLLHAIPYPNADRVVYVNQQPNSGNNTGISVTITPGAAVVRSWREGSRSFEDLEPAIMSPRTLKTTSGEPSIVMTGAVLPSFPTFAGERPILGRMFTTTDIVEGGRVVVLGEGFWRQRLASDAQVLGKTLTIGDSAYTVVGVMPAALRFGSPGRRPTDAWMPMDLRNDKLGAALIGRLRPGVSMNTARVELDSIYARTAGFTSGKAPFNTVISAPGERVQFRASLLLLTGAVALVLLVACANVAHLLLARTATRRRELAIRAALGAGRGRILRQLLTESFLLSIAGMAGGVFVGWAGLRALIAMRPSSHNELQAAHLDTTTLLLAIGVSIASGIAFGVVGALQSARTSTHDSLKNGALSASAGRRHARVRSLLVVSEMALSAMLIVGAALVVRSLQRLQATDLGFDPVRLYTLYPTFGARTKTPESRAQFMSDYSARIRATPGVRSAVLVETGPGSRSFSVGRLELDGETPPPATSSSFIDVNHVDPAYFATMGIKLVSGATFSDTTAQSREVIVNEGFARKHWPANNALGHRVRIARKNDEPWLTIVGVARNALTSGPGSESTTPMLYLPPGGELLEAIVVRAPGDAKSLTPIAGVGRDLGAKIVTVDGVEAFIDRSVSEPRFVMLVMTVFGALGLALASIGLYGVMAYTVAQETREIGIRVALGASRADIVRRVLIRGTALAIVGALVGLCVATWGTRLIENQLYGVERLDPSSFVAGAVVLIGAALLACIVPSRRALAVDPMTAIRAE